MVAFRPNTSLNLGLTYSVRKCRRANCFIQSNIFSIPRRSLIKMVYPMAGYSSIDSGATMSAYVLREVG